MHMSSASLREGGGGGGHTWENVGTLTQILPHVVGEMWGNKGTWSALLGEIWGLCIWRFSRDNGDNINILNTNKSLLWMILYLCCFWNWH